MSIFNLSPTQPNQIRIQSNQAGNQDAHTYRLLSF